jgi:hypothetical protein
MFSGVQRLVLVDEHCVHCPASGPVVLHTGSSAYGHMKGTDVVAE